MSTSACKFFLKGSCKYGAECKFRHEEASATPRQPNQRQQPHAQSKPKSRGGDSVNRGSHSRTQAPANTGDAVVSSKPSPASNSKYLHSKPPRNILSSQYDRSQNRKLHGAATMGNRGGGSRKPRAKICKLCGRRARPDDMASFSCCYGQTKKDFPVFPSAELMNYCLSSKSKWKVSGRKSFPGHGSFVSSDLSRAVERDILAFLQRVAPQSIRGVEMHGHGTSPWSIRASDMSSGGSLLDCFAAKAKVFGAPRDLSSASIGGVLHSLLDRGCESGSMGADWGMAKSKYSTVDEEGLNIRVHGSCDAVYKGMFPVELKTVDDMTQVDSHKVRGWLLQIAIYQILYGNSKAVLVVVCRKSFELRAFEVREENARDAVASWRNFVAQQPLLGEFIVLSRPYCRAVEGRRGRPVGPGDNPRLFLELLEQSVSVLLLHTRLVLVQHQSQVQLGNVSAAIVSFLRGVKYLKMLKATIASLKCTDFNDVVTTLSQTLEQCRAGAADLAAASMARGELMQAQGGAEGLQRAMVAFGESFGLYCMLGNPRSAPAQSAKSRKLRVKAILRDMNVDVTADDLSEGELEAMLQEDEGDEEDGHMDEEAESEGGGEGGPGSDGMDIGSSPVPLA